MFVSKHSGHFTRGHRNANGVRTSRWKSVHGVVRNAKISTVQYVVNTIKTADTLVPYQKDAVNLGIFIWDLIDCVPPADRGKILDHLSDSDIMRLWRLAGDRSKASIPALAMSKVPNYSIWEDMPKTGSQTSIRFRGRAVLPMASRLGNFEKELFHLNARQTDQVEETCSDLQIYGRVQHSGPIGFIKETVYPGPLYFKVFVGSSIVPLLSDTCDMIFSYSLEESGVKRISNIAGTQRWQAPRLKNLPPFDDDFTEYIRVVGPGMFVGLGYKEISEKWMIQDDILSHFIPRPLFFAMVREE